MPDRAERRLYHGDDVHPASPDQDQTLDHRPKPRRIFERDYIYRQPSGEEWFRRRRYQLVPVVNGRSKTIVYGWKVGDTWYPWKRRGADELLYRLPELMAAKSSASTIFWTEGEKDADAVVAAGRVATSHHGGAGKVNSRQARWLVNHPGLVVLLYDLDPDDRRGGNAGAMDVIRRYDLLRDVGVPREQIRVAHALEGKDVADHLAAGHTLEDLVWVTSLGDLRIAADRTARSTLRRTGYRTLR